MGPKDTPEATIHRLEGELGARRAELAKLKHLVKRFCNYCIKENDSEAEGICKKCCLETAREMSQNG